MKPNFFVISLLLLFSFGCKDIPKEKTQQNTQKKRSTAKDEKLEQKNIQKEDNKDLEYLIPEGARTIDSVFGKLKNGKEIAVFVLDSKNDENEEEDRTLLILEKTVSGYRQMAINKELILCKSCGGIFGDPYNGVTLKGNVLSISNYGGSAWRWSENYTFRYQNSDWQLIGATYQSYWTNAPCTEDQDVTSGAGQLEDINFSTNKMHIVHTKDNSCEPFEDYQQQFKKMSPISLSDFPGKGNQWPNGKIKDGDGE